jgi:hypothetical protein
LLLAAEGVDHPRRHIVDGNVGGGRRAALREFLEDERGIEPGKRRSADILLHVDAAEAERGCLAQGVDGKHLALIPIARMRHHLRAGEIPRGGLKGALLFVQVEIQGRLRLAVTIMDARRGQAKAVARGPAQRPC